MKTKASAGTLRGESGFQDLSLWLKGKVINFEINPKHRLEVMASVGLILRLDLIMLTICLCL